MDSEHIKIAYDKTEEQIQQDIIDIDKEIDALIDSKTKIKKKTIKNLIYGVDNVLDINQD